MSKDIRVKTYGERYDDNYRSDKIAAMREMLDFLESHPEVPIPVFNTFYINSYDLDVWDGDEVKNYTEADMPQMLAIVTREMARNGRVKKVANDWSFGVRREFGNVENNNEVAIEYSTARDFVCKKVKTGVVKTTTERRMVSEPVYETVEVEVEETAWECPPILAKLDNAETV